MGVLSDYYRAADDTSALRALSGGPHAVGFATVALKHIDPVVILGVLVALARDVDWDPDLTATTLISPDNSDGPWISTIGDDARDTLASIEPSRQEQLATNWAAAEEFGGLVSVEDCAAMIAELASLAGEAVAAKQRLYCWIGA
jgi:hypothetical protein